MRQWRMVRRRTSQPKQASLLAPIEVAEQRPSETSAPFLLQRSRKQQQPARRSALSAAIRCISTQTKKQPGPVCKLALIPAVLLLYATRQSANQRGNYIVLFGNKRLPELGGIVASSFSTLRKKQRGPEGASNMVPQRGRPLWTPPAPPHRGIGGGVHPTGASQGRAATRWVLSLLVRGLAAPPDRQECRPAVGIGCDRSIANNWHERFIHEKSRLR